MLLRLNVKEFVSKGVQLPMHMLKVLREVPGLLSTTSQVDLAVLLADALPSGIYSGSGVEQYGET